MIQIGGITSPHMSDPKNIVDEATSPQIRPVRDMSLGYVGVIPRVL